MTEVRNGRLSIRLVSGDITRMETDAIVSSSNSRLWMGGGVAGAIRSAAGKNIQLAALAKGPISIGDAVATAAGQLKTRFVIHAATTGMDFHADPEMVRITVRNVLKRARELGISSVAFPALGAGLGGLSPEESARAMIGEITAQAHQRSTVTQVLLVATGDSVYRALESALLQFARPGTS